MADLILFAALAVSVIIGYRLMGWIDRKIDEHVADDDETEQENQDR